MDSLDLDALQRERERKIKTKIRVSFQKSIFKHLEKSSVCPEKDHTCGFACFCPLIRNHSYPSKQSRCFLDWFPTFQAKNCFPFILSCGKRDIFFQSHVLEVEEVLFSQVLCKTIVALQFQGHSFPRHRGINFQTASLLLEREQKVTEGQICICWKTVKYHSNVIGTQWNSTKKKAVKLFSVVKSLFILKLRMYSSDT